MSVTIPKATRGRRGGSHFQTAERVERGSPLVLIRSSYFCPGRADLMERRVMSHHYYKLRDFEFAQHLVTLRKKAGLTQEDVALRIGLSEKAIRNWEGGSNYPKELNLRKLIEMYLGKNVFAT